MSSSNNNTFDSGMSRDDIRQSLARITSPKAMVAKMWDEEKNRFGRSAVKVVCVDDKLDKLKYSDAWVSNDDDVKVGNSYSVSLLDLGDVTVVDSNVNTN